MKLKCSKCSRVTCISCFTMILTKIKLTDYDHWCNEVTTYIKKGIIPNQFIGHCCEIEHHKTALRNSVCQKKNMMDGCFYLN